MKQELAHIRELGYALDNGEQEERVRCVSVPIHGVGHRVIATISISGPASRLDETRTEALVPHLKRVSDELSTTLTTPTQNG